MEPAARDDTEDWLLPELARPPLIGELEQRIDLAMAMARSSEAAVIKVGGAALDAAERARHAAELAESASLVALKAQEEVESIAVAPKPPVQREQADDSLSNFSERADRLVARLRGLQRIPLAPPAASVAAGRPQPAR